MVGLKLKYAFVATLAVILSVGGAAAQEFDPDGYELLVRQQRRLQLRAETVSERLSSSRNLYETNPCDSLAETISELEYQYAVIVERSREVRDELAAADSLRLAEEAAAQIAASDNDTLAAETTIVLHPERDAFRAIAARYDADERSIPLLAAHYGNIHRSASNALDRYRTARNIAATEQAAAEYARLTDDAKAVADSIAYTWDNISLEKSDAYFRLIDSLGLVDLKEDYTEQVHRTEESLEQFVGRYSDGDLAMYPLRKRDMLDFERRIAAYIGLAEESDSLAHAAAAITEEEYRFEPLRMLQRAEMQFEEAVTEPKTRYRSVKSIGAIAPPSKGYLYTILLGSFKGQPGLDVFRSFAPLYSEYRADGRTYYYTGLYPTEFSAADAIERLRAAGFKKPTVTMWHNGLRRDDFNSTLTPAEAVAQTKVYKVEIVGTSSTLPDEAMAVIRRDAPRKEISKIAADDGTFVFTVGSFSSRDEADALSKSIGKLLQTKVIEIIL